MGGRSARRGRRLEGAAATFETDKKNTFFKDWLFIRNTFFNEMRTFLNRRGEGVFPHERFPLPGVPRARRAPPRVRRDERRSREDHG